MYMCGNFTFTSVKSLDDCYPVKKGVFGGESHCLCWMDKYTSLIYFVVFSSTVLCFVRSYVYTIH